MVDLRGNEAQSDQMKADDRGIERTSGPCDDLFQKNLAKVKHVTRISRFQKCP